jgi:hypothetical protein
VLISLLTCTRTNDIYSYLREHVSVKILKCGVDESNHPHRRQEMTIISSNFSAEKACRSRKHTISQGMLSRKDITNGMWSYLRCHAGAKKSTCKSKRTSEGARASYLQT